MAICTTHDVGATFQMLHITQLYLCPNRNNAKIHGSNLGIIFYQFTNSIFSQIAVMPKILDVCADEINKACFFFFC